MQAVQDSEVVGNDTWTEYARDIYRTVCAELAYLDMGENGTPHKVRSSKMAWLRRRISTMEPEQVAHTVRPHLQVRRADLDSITAAWLPFVSEPVGPNDSYHDEYWSSLSWHKEKLVLSAGFELLCTEPSVRILLISFFEQASKHCPATTAKCSLFSGLCSQARNRTFCGMPSTTGPFPLRKASVNHPTTRSNDDYDLTDRPGLTPRGRLCTALSQSLPGPDSRDESTVPLLQIQERSLVDVQVGGLVGQQPPEAESKRFPGSLFKANQHDQALQFGSPQGTNMHESCNFCRSPKRPCYTLKEFSDRSGIPCPSPFPPEALAGMAVILMLVMQHLKPHPKPYQPWQVARIIKGIYRRKPVPARSRPDLNAPSRPKHQSSAAGSVGCTKHFHLLLVMAVLLHNATAAPMPPIGTSAIQTPFSLGTTNLCSRKLSFRRAQRQALDKGSTLYRGRLMTAKQLGVEKLSAKPTRSKHIPRASSHNSSIRVITWNSGGFNLARQTEVRTWLEQESLTNPTHVLCIQETHWPTTTEYRDGPWTCIHSGSGSREGGVLVMLNTKYFQDVDIKHAEIKPGRLLHVRICSNPAIDLLCVYQHAWNPAKAEYQQRSLSAEQLLLNNRQDIWQRMQGWIAGVPKRNLLAVLGDFNAALSPHHPHVGTGVGPAHDHKKDGHALQSLIQTAGLNAINTWRKRGSQASTFWTHRGEGSQIDFILTRNPCALSQLRPSALPQAPIVRPTGFRHVPVQCYLQWPKPPRTTQSPQVTALQVKKHVQQVSASARAFP